MPSGEDKPVISVFHSRALCISYNEDEIAAVVEVMRTQEPYPRRLYAKIRRRVESVRRRQARVRCG